MKKFILELRRREVFRTAGLYVGVAWILVEGASIVLPTFDAPDWALRWLIILAFIGFPVALVLAWIYDISDGGIHVQSDHADTIVEPLFSRKTDFMVIGVLSVALIFSLYLNISSGPDAIEDIEPVTILIADFDNQTGDPLFDGSLEQALNLGIEGATFISTYPRTNALTQARELELGDTLAENVARLIAVRQGIGLTLAGSITKAGDEFELRLRAVDPTGQVVADINADATSRSDVLAAVNSLAADMRKELGDNSLDVKQLASGEAITATSLEAIKDYVTAQDLARASQDEEAITYYKKAIERDPDFARAYSGWGLSAFKIGRNSEAEEQWDKALSLLDRMTERERYRTLGLYYTRVSLNYDNAIENFAKLVEKYPADGAGHNNLSVLYFLTLQFDKAVAESARLIKIYPKTTLYRSNHALNAMWAGDLETAVTAAESVIAEDPAAFKPFIVLAMAALDAGDNEAALSAYQRMAATGPRGKSLADIGVADVALFAGDAKQAETVLLASIEDDRSGDNERGIGVKTIALAETYLAEGKNTEALEALRSVSMDSLEDGLLVPGAIMFAKLGEFDAAKEIADRLGNQLRPQSRAYAKLIGGVIELERERFVPAIDELKAALGFADLWIVHYYLGQAYLAAQYPVEAGAEFDAAYERRGEAMAMFFDDIPTWRYMAPLATWSEKARGAVAGMSKN
ncbi:MAG: tetratricopeptide repeat protein [Gammaproteobacteria bacterium]|nr:tetratricopeptide repeat protein [Gammaproteobacteria bacterium]MDH5261868.1 tetratricopeptide repeat protein [Gammaproteobacteria bacterium]MDH5620847.1 tetratricopeptide repeat protein [Gammaproteobacteria bacterium]